MNRYELLRYERGLTRSDVVEGSGVSIATIQALETFGDARKPTAPVAKALADFYEISVPEFMGVEEKAA